MIVTDESKIATYDGGIINVKVYRNEDSHSRTANGIRCRLTHNGSLPKILDIICEEFLHGAVWACLLYTSDAADDLLCVDLGGRSIIKKKKNNTTKTTEQILTSQS